jgi:hypothetical protein
MNTLLSLEPRVAGDASLEPHVDFPGYQGNLHYVDALPSRCPTEYGTICTNTICIDGTRYCF